jgi:hypothetical protein
MSGERSETVRDGMSQPVRFTRTARLFNIQSDPCESRAVREEGGCGNAPLESRNRGHVHTCTGLEYIQKCSFSAV